MHVVPFAAAAPAYAVSAVRLARMRSPRSLARLMACMRDAALPLARKVVTYRLAMPSMPTARITSATSASTIVKPRSVWRFANLNLRALMGKSLR